MKFAKKVLVAVNLEDSMPAALKSLSHLEFLKTCDIHFVYGVVTTSFAIGLTEGTFIYPIPEDRRAIEVSTVTTLKRISESLFSDDFQGRLSQHCLFSDDPKEAICDYIKEHHIDLVIMAAREKRGIFESSFSTFITKHTKANVLILKHGI